MRIAGVQYTFTKPQTRMHTQNPQPGTTLNDNTQDTFEKNSNSIANVSFGWNYKRLILPALSEENEKVNKSVSDFIGFVISALGNKLKRNDIIRQTERASNGTLTFTKYDAKNKPLIKFITMPGEGIIDVERYVNDKLFAREMHNLEDNTREISFFNIKTGKPYPEIIWSPEKQEFSYINEPEVQCITISDNPKGDRILKAVGKKFYIYCCGEKQEIWREISSGWNSIETNNGIPEKAQEYVQSVAKVDYNTKRSIVELKYNYDKNEDFDFPITLDDVFNDVADNFEQYNAKEQEIQSLLHLADCADEQLAKYLDKYESLINKYQ